MTKFNKTNTIKTQNKCGNVAYSMKDKEKLVTQVLTSFFNENKFYGDNSKDIEETIKRVIKTDAKFISNLAVFARREFNIRSISHILTAYLAHEIEGKPYTRLTVKAVAMRGDDITEIMACYIKIFGKPIPNSLKKGINDVLAEFDEYTLAKYKGNGKSVKMRDLLCLCRPKPKTKQQADLWKKVLENTLEIPLTWETELSANGNNAEIWERLIDSDKVGYMALLRNLRNIIKANPSNINKVFEIIESPERVKKSKQLPFRFLSAYNSVKDIADSKTIDVLENAIISSVENLPKIEGKTVIAVDVSGSMDYNISDNSSIQCYQIALLLGLIANRICENCVFYTFTTRIQKHAISHKTAILESISNFVCGGGTDMSLPFQKMIDEKLKADRIIILSDNECNNIYSPVQSYADKYRRLTNNDLWVHAIDLQGYGTQQFIGKHTNIISGWSEKVFDFIMIAEKGKGNLEKSIEEYIF